MELEGLEKPNPPDVFSMVAALVEHILSPSAEDFATIMSARGDSTSHPDLGVPLEAMEEMLPQEDLKHVQVLWPTTHNGMWLRCHKQNKQNNKHPLYLFPFSPFTTLSPVRPTRRQPRSTSRRSSSGCRGSGSIMVP
eukprot:5775459-Lingulodinium_polyedra.AAC.1